MLKDGPYFVTVQALNSIVFGGALVTSVCHSTPIIVDTTAPWLDFVEDIFYDEDFDLLGVYYKGKADITNILLSMYIVMSFCNRDLVLKQCCYNTTMTLIGLESIRSIRLACQRLKLTNSQIEDIFYNNYKQM